MSTLIDKLTGIKTAKDNLKAAFEGMGLNPGNDFSSYANFAQEQLQPVGSGVKLFSTIAEMDADPNPSEGDLAVVYKNEQQNMTADMEVTAITFPETVTLPTAFTGRAYGRLNSVDSSVMFDSDCMLDKNSFRFDSWSGSGSIRASYTSTDGITYTRTRLQGDNPIKLPTAVKGDANEWNDNFGYFMQVGTSVFEGIYIYKNNSWKLAPTQLTATPDYVYEKEFYGKNGAGTGTLTQDISNSFNDASAKLYNKIQNRYESMAPRILTDSDKTIDTSIYCIPVKRDGTPLLDTSNVTDMDIMFNNCKNLTTIPLLNTSSATNMAYMFNNCSNLTAIPLLDTSNVTNMDAMFNNCSNLTAIPLLDTSSATDMNTMFYGCTNLTTIPLLDTSNVTDMNAMFAGCSSLTTIPLLDTSNVTNMNAMFHSCTNLTTIPELDTSSATNMDDMFNGCTNLTTIPELDTSNVTNMNAMFYNCTNLTTIPELDTSNVTYMDDMFNGCTNLTTIPELNTSKVVSMTDIFGNCSRLTAIPQLDTSSATDMAYMFAGCSSLTTIPLLNTSKVTRITDMFGNCSRLTAIPQLDTSSATDMNSMFYNCSSLNNESLNNILAMCANAAKITSNKTLKYIRLTEEQAQICTTLSNWSAFTAAGWTTGY